MVNKWRLAVILMFTLSLVTSCSGDSQEGTTNEGGMDPPGTLDPYNPHITPPSAPPSATIELTASLSGTSVLLSWNEVPGAESYTVYFHTPESSGRIPVANVTITRYTHEIGGTPKTYIYEVTALKEGLEFTYSNEARVTVSPLSTVAPDGPTTTTTGPETGTETGTVSHVELTLPTDISAIPHDGYVTINFSGRIPYDMSTRIIYSLRWGTSADDITHRIVEIPSPFDHGSLTNGVTYYYKIEVYSFVTHEILFSPVFTATPFTAAPERSHEWMEPCAHTSECAPSLDCRSGRCLYATHSVSWGEHCYQHDECIPAAGIECRTGICAKATGSVNVGEECHAYDECMEGLRCEAREGVSYICYDDTAPGFDLTPRNMATDVSTRTSVELRFNEPMERV